MRPTLPLTGPTIDGRAAWDHAAVSEVALLAELVRSGFVEGRHYGHAVIVDPTGDLVAAWGDPQAVIFPRSANKPAQAGAMVRAGLELDPRLLALAASSHSGEAEHLVGVEEILAGAGLAEQDLRTPADLPLDPVERDAWVRADRPARPIAMNCSGKHAAMLATCAIKEWDVQTYREAHHPLQRAIADELTLRAGEPIAHLGVDGCGAPVMAISLAGLARSLSALVQSDSGDPGRRVVDAMRAHPEMVGGSRREVTAVMSAVAGLVLKDGAEGVYVGALPDGRAFALKVMDGSDRARTVTIAAVLSAMGFEDEMNPWRRVAVLGHGAPVGEVRSTLT